MKNKIFDCVTFFDNNFMFDFRYNVLKDVVDYFIVCESKYDHKGNKKKLNFIRDKNFDQDKIKYFVLEKPFPKNTNTWQNQAIQRDYLLSCTELAEQEDYIFFSDPDEIPRPEILINFELKKNMAFSCKNALIINSIYITHMKAHGKGRECVKKKI